jgi:hypothetical protein
MNQPQTPDNEVGNQMKTNIKEVNEYINNLNNEVAMLRGLLKDDATFLRQNGFDRQAYPRKVGKGMSKKIDQILQELGMETSELPPINMREALKMGLIEGCKKPKQGACGKSVYQSQSNCDEAIKHRLRSKFGGTSFLRAYFCKTCAAWHMSSSRTKLNK